MKKLNHDKKNKSKTAIVTGGAGFIGSHLVDKLLKNNFKVVVIDNFKTGTIKNLSQHKKNKNLKIIKKDISIRGKIDKHFKNINYVFHIAGLADIVPSIERPEEYYDTNISGTFNVIRASQKNKIKKFIYAASASCYGIPNRYPTSENCEIKTQYPYALSKWIGEQLVLHWHKVFKFPAISMRFFNVYGKRSRTSGAYGAMFGVFLAQKLKNYPLTVVGDGKQTRDFIHISDLVEAIYKAAKSKKNGMIYNIASGKETSVNKIVSLLGGKKINIPKRPGEPDRSLANISLAKKQLKWKPKVNIESGIKDLISNIKLWSDAPIWTKKKIKKATKVWFDYLKK